MYVKTLRSIVTLDAAVGAVIEPASRNSFKKQLQTLTLGTALETGTNSVRNSFRTCHETDSPKNILL